MRRRVRTRERVSNTVIGEVNERMNVRVLAIVSVTEASEVYVLRKTSRRAMESVMEADEV